MRWRGSSRAWTILLQEMRGEAVVRGLKREDRHIYPLFAVREALVNAVCHRDYRLTGAASRSGSTTTAWRSAAPAACPATSRWTTSSRSISRATRAW